MHVEKGPADAEQTSHLADLPALSCQNTTE
jgi:hypothetical protein